MLTWNKRRETGLREAFTDVDAAYFQPITDGETSQQTLLSQSGETLTSRHRRQSRWDVFIHYEFIQSLCMKHVQRADPYIT